MKGSSLEAISLTYMSYLYYHMDKKLQPNMTVGCNTDYANASTVE